MNDKEFTRLINIAQRGFAQLGLRSALADGDREFTPMKARFDVERAAE